MATASASTPTDVPYTGPSVATMLATHTLAHEIISRASSSCPILDTSELSLLKRFILTPSSGPSILSERGWVDAEGEKAGTNAHKKDGSLVGYVVAHSVRGQELLDEDEKVMLREWFGDDGGRRD